MTTPTRRAAAAAQALLRGLEQNIGARSKHFQTYQVERYPSTMASSGADYSRVRQCVLELYILTMAMAANTEQQRAVRVPTNP